MFGLAEQASVWSTDTEENIFKPGLIKVLGVAASFLLLAAVTSVTWCLGVCPFGVTSAIVAELGHTFVAEQELS